MVGRSREVRMNFYLFLGVLEVVSIFVARRERGLPGGRSLRSEEIIFLFVAIV
jgi:hypothetical protein